MSGGLDIEAGPAGVLQEQEVRELEDSLAYWLRSDFIRLISLVDVDIYLHLQVLPTKLKQKQMWCLLNTNQIRY